MHPLWRERTRQANRRGGTDIKTFFISLLVPVTVTVDADNEAEALTLLFTHRCYEMTSPDGEHINLDEDDIQWIEVEEKRT
jgi:hypothetical protein